MKPLALIVAVAENGVIGKDGGLPWHVPEDREFFESMTRGHAIIMGRRTFDEVGEPLPGRRNLVVSRSVTSLPGCEIFATVEDAIAAARTSDALPFIIGGAAIYAAALPYVTKIYLTKIPQRAEGDRSFPALDPNGWREVEHRKTHAAEYVTLERI